MTLHEITQRLEAAFKPLAPTKILIIDTDETIQPKPFIVVQIVAQGFEHIRPATRCRVLDDTLAQRDPHLRAAFQFVYEAFTQAEHGVIRHTPLRLH